MTTAFAGSGRILLHIHQSRSIEMLRFAPSLRETTDLAIILAGGRGTRLGSLTDRTPKPLIPVAGRPFLLWLVAEFLRQGVRRFIVSTGYRAEQFAFPFSQLARTPGISVSLLQEQRPLGTGGALAFASKGVSEPFYACNGDTLVAADLDALDAAVEMGSDAAVLALRRVPDGSRYGIVELDDDRVAGFKPRGSAAPAQINAGIYRLVPGLLPDDVPDEPLSLENALFPIWSEAGRLWAAGTGDAFIDIGVPADLRRAQRYVPDRWARPVLFVAGRKTEIAPWRRRYAAAWRRNGGWVAHLTGHGVGPVPSWADLATSTVARVAKTIPVDLSRSIVLTPTGVEPLAHRNEQGHPRWWTVS